MRNLRRIVGIALAAALAAGLGCEKKESGGGPSAGAGGTPGNAGAGGAARTPAPDAQVEVCGPEMTAKEEAASQEKLKAELAPKQKKVAEAVAALEAALTEPLRVGRAPDRARFEPLVGALGEARAALGAELGSNDLLGKATELVEWAQTCRAVQGDDPAQCAKLGQSPAASVCRGRIVQLRRLGAAMIGARRCDQALADAAAKIEKARGGAPLLAICEAAVTADAAKCGSLTEAPQQAICSALATGDGAACGKLEEKQRVSCLSDAALVAGASGGVAKTPEAQLPAGAKILIDAARGQAGKTACVDDAARRWSEHLAVLK